MGFTAIIGDKANHIPAFHVPQLYYFIGFTTAFGWPVLISGGDPRILVHDVWKRMFGGKMCSLSLDRIFTRHSLTFFTRRSSITGAVFLAMGLTVKLFTSVLMFLFLFAPVEQSLDLGSTIPSCCPTIGITHFIYGAESTCSTLLYPTY